MVRIYERQTGESRGFRAVGYLCNSCGSLARVDGEAHHFRPRSSERFDLLGGSLDIGGVGVRHRLHDNGRITADAHRSD